MAFANVVRCAAALAVCSLLAACGTVEGTQLSASDLAYARINRGTTPAGPAEDPTLFPDDMSDSGPARLSGALECVPYARAHSSVNIRGDAYTWWEKAAGVYQRSAAPGEGSVMVMVGYAGRHRGHVAVVRRVVTPREIRIDHANWLNDGAIYVSDPVLDVSPDNDWSRVKVWNIRSGSWGTKVYMVRGFIGPGPANSSPLISANDPIARQIAASDASRAPAVAPAEHLRWGRAVR
jgi:surface antigen